MFFQKNLLDPPKANISPENDSWKNMFLLIWFFSGDRGGYILKDPACLSFFLDFFHQKKSLKLRLFVVLWVMKSYPQLYEEIDSIGHGLYYPVILTYKELPHLEQRTTQLYQPEALGGSSQVVSIGPTRIGLFTFQKAH